jgi:hypothetical protein
MFLSWVTGLLAISPALAVAVSSPAQGTHHFPLVRRSSLARGNVVGLEKLASAAERLRYKYKIKTTTGPSKRASSADIPVLDLVRHQFFASKISVRHQQ